MDKRRKSLKPMRKGKSKKRAKDEEVNGQGEKTGERRCPGPTWGNYRWISNYIPVHFPTPIRSALFRQRPHLTQSVITPNCDLLTSYLRDRSIKKDCPAAYSEQCLYCHWQQACRIADWLLGSIRHYSCFFAPCTNILTYLLTYL